MKAALTVLATVFAAICQVTVAPLFPVAGVEVEFVLLTLICVAAFGSPQRAMVAIPVAALSYGFLADRAPGLLLLGYMPILPLMLYLEEAPIPLNHYAGTLLAMVSVGVWVRLLMVISALLAGATAGPGDVLRHALLPGVFLDFALLSIAYLPLRLLGWSGRGMALRRGTYYSSL
jgi:hypothetical protein